MENVKIGILFTTTGPIDPSLGKPLEKYPGASMAFTTIDDVDIHLTNDDVDAVGIQVGDIYLSDDIDTYPIVENGASKDVCFMAPYSARIRAHVRLGNADGTGLKIAKNGQLFYGQSQLTVTRTTPGLGTGIQIDEPNPNGRGEKAIWEQQFSNGGYPNGGFMLITSNITTPINNQIPNTSNNEVVDVTVKNF